MSTHHISTEKLTLDEIDNILVGHQSISLSENVLSIIENCRSYLLDKLRTEDRPVYGINTGFGSLCDVKISREDLDKLQLNLVRSHACGMGDRVPDDISRLILLLKIINMSLGHSGVRVDLVQRMVDIYNNGVVPTIYELGSLGASGDLAPLAHLALTIIGEDKHNDQIDFFPLKEKEGIAMLNGTQFSLAYGIHSLLQMEKLFELSLRIAAMSLDAFRCDTSPFDMSIHHVRAHEGQVYVATRINELRKGSGLADLPLISVQDPYSFRCIPQVMGATYDAMLHAKKIFTVELNSVTDNPLIFPEEDKILSGGNFHAQPLAMVLDYLAMSASELANISERRIYQLINGDRGLPYFLVDEPGINSGYMIPQYAAASIVSQNKQLTTPASTDSIVSCKGQEDHVSMAANAGTKLWRVVNNLKRILSIELLVAAQALDYRRPNRSSSVVEALHEALRKEVPRYHEDRIMQHDLEKAEAFIEQSMRNTA